MYKNIGENCSDCRVLLREIATIDSIRYNADEMWEQWADEFFKENNLSHLIEKFHSFLSDKVDGND